MFDFESSEPANWTPPYSTSILSCTYDVMHYKTQEVFPFCLHYIQMIAQAVIFMKLMGVRDHLSLSALCKEYS